MPYPWAADEVLLAGDLNAAIAQCLAAAGVSVSSSVAAAGLTQSTGTPLVSVFNIVTTVDAGAGVVLANLPNQEVLNRGINPLVVWAPPGGQIDATGTNAFVTIDPGGASQFTQGPTNQFTSH